MTTYASRRRKADRLEAISHAFARKNKLPSALCDHLLAAIILRSKDADITNATAAQALKELLRLVVALSK